MLFKMVHRISLLTCFIYIALKISSSIFSATSEDPVVNMNISEVIRSYNVKAEEHYVTTEDGYKVLVERAYTTVTKDTPIILVHGMFMDAIGYVNNGEKSLGLILANLGYDVWLLSYRGTRNSRGHLNLTTDDKAYWQYSLNDLGIYDVRSTLKYVKDVTKKKPIYIGYSMGTTGFFIYSSTFPEESQRMVKGMIALAPATTFKKSESLIIKINRAWPYVKTLMYNLYNGELPPMTNKICGPFLGFRTGIYACQYLFNLLFGDNYDQMDFDYLPRYFAQIPVSTSVEAYSHYMQIYKSGIFQNYDHGKERNVKVYGREKPPAYDLSRISVPISVFAGSNDWLTTLQNAEEFYEQLQPSSRCGFHVVDFKKWNHVDFFCAKDVVPYLYAKVIDKLKKIDSGICSP